MLRNKIKEVLKKKGVSVLALSKMMGKEYYGIHLLCNREFLDDTKLGNLHKVSKLLNVSIYDLFEEIEK